jgi:hypothetical protein
MNGNILIDPHGDGKVVLNLSRNEAFHLMERLIVMMEPREYQTILPPSEDA